MKKIWFIFSRDLKNIGTNWAVAIIIGGLIFLPSLYAWLNIAAMWDPYSHTDKIPVGVVNEDNGADIKDRHIDAGKDLVDTLKKNNDLNWKFTNRKKAMDKLEYGDYFAVIVIPENFSERLGTVVSDKPEKARMEYYVNEKINSISPKITQKGASVLVDQVSSKFVSTVNGVIFELFNDIGIELKKDLPDIERFEDYVFKLEKDLPEINRLINGSLSDADAAEDMIHQAQQKVPEAKRLTNNGLDTVNQTSAFLNKAESRLKELAPKVNQDLEKVQKVSRDVNQFLSSIDERNVDVSQGKEIQNKVNDRLNTAVGNLDEIEKALVQIGKLNKENKEEGKPDADPQIQAAIEKTQKLKGGLQNIQSSASEISGSLNDKQQEINQTFTDIKKAAGNTSMQIDAFAKEYKESIEPTVKSQITQAQKTLNGANDLLSGIQSSLPEVEKILSSTDSRLTEGKSHLEYAQGEFPYINEKITRLADKIRSVQGETDINEIIKLLINDPNAERSFFEEPVQLEENKVFPIKNYGTGMTPFYTVLSIWVGALLLISLLSTDIRDHQAFNGRQVYFGRYLTFLSIGFLQTLIVTFGDLLIMKVPAAHPVWLVLFGLFIAVIFMLIVYTLVSVFGNIGKAMAIVLLVLQIAGSGGTYPVVLLPGFFQAVSPYLPFTYAVDLMREAVGGIVWSRAGRDLFFLTLFGIGFLLFGSVFKEAINKRTTALLRKSRETDLFH